MIMVMDQSSRQLQRCEWRSRNYQLVGESQLSALPAVLLSFQMATDRALLKTILYRAVPVVLSS